MVSVGFGVRGAPHSARGFTLLELLVTTSLMALVGGATVAALSGGIRVWERTVDFGTHQQAALIAFDRMRHDFQNVRHFTPVTFAGVYDQVAFPGVDRANPLSEGPAEIGRVGYFLDEPRHLLCRSFTPYRRMRQERVTDQCHPALEGVTWVRFSYVGTDAQGGSTGWSESWRSALPPMAIKAEVAVAGSGQQATTHSSVVYLSSVTSDDDDDDHAAKP